MLVWAPGLASADTPSTLGTASDPISSTIEGAERGAAVDNATKNDLGNTVTPGARDGSPDEAPPASLRSEKPLEAARSLEAGRSPAGTAGQLAGVAGTDTNNIDAKNLNADAQPANKLRSATSQADTVTAPEAVADTTTQLTSRTESQTSVLTTGTVDETAQVLADAIDQVGTGNQAAGRVVETVVITTEPVLETLNQVIAPLTETVVGTTEPVLQTLNQVIAPLTETAVGTTEPVLGTLNQAAARVVETAVGTTEPVLETLNQVIAPLTETVVGTTEPVLDTRPETASPLTRKVAAEPVVQPVNQTTHPALETVGEPAGPVVHALGNTAPEHGASAQPATGTLAKPSSSTTWAPPRSSRMADATLRLLGATEIVELAPAVAEHDSALAFTRPPAEALMTGSSSFHQQVGPLGIWRLFALSASPSSPSGGMAELLQRTLGTPPAALAWLFMLMLGLLWMKAFFGSSTLRAIPDRPG
jgi:hypothetical protein